MSISLMRVMVAAMHRPDWRAVIQRFVRRGVSRAVPAVSVPGASDVLMRLPASYKAAADSLASPGRIGDIAFRAQVLAIDRSLLHADVQAFIKTFLRDLERRNIPLFPVDGFRDAKTQQRLFKQGVTKARAGQSPHNYGLAVDFVHSTKFWDLNRLQWDVIGLIGKESARKCNVKVTWGGDWSFYDPAHWELRDWKNRK